MLEGIICPNCGANINEMDLRDKLACTNCKKDLKDRSYLDFLEYLMTNGIVEKELSVQTVVQTLTKWIFVTNSLAQFVRKILRIVVILIFLNTL